MNTPINEHQDYPETLEFRDYRHENKLPNSEDTYKERRCKIAHIVAESITKQKHYDILNEQRQQQRQLSEGVATVTTDFTEYDLKIENGLAVVKIKTRKGAVASLTFPTKMLTSMELFNMYRTLDRL